MTEAAPEPTAVPGLAGKILHRYRRLIVVLPLIGAVAALAFGVAVPSFVARSSIQPVAAEASLSRFAGIAAQFGIAVPGGGSASSVDFYARVLLSRGVLESVSKTSYEQEDGTAATLVDIVASPDVTPTRALQDAADWLEDHTRLALDITAGILTIETRAPTASLAESINRQYLLQIDSFNVRSQQSVAAAERRFLDQRLRDAEDSLRDAEESLRAFYAANRAYASSPDLMVELGRLNRRVELAQQVYGSLAQAREQARIEEVRNTPVITIIENPEGSARPRRLVRLASLGLTLGAVLAFAGIALMESITAVYGAHSGASRSLRWLGEFLRLLPG